MSYAYAPNGLLIIGTLEKLQARADIERDSFVRLPDGMLEFNHDGYTEVFWDGQETCENEDGKTIFLDTEGNEWTYDQLTISDEAPGLKKVPA